MQRHAALRGLATAIVTVTFLIVTASTTVAANARPVSAATYAKTVCGAIATYHADLLGVSAPYQLAALAFREGPTAATATRVRQTFVDLLDEMQGSSRDVVGAASRVTPTGKAGARFAKALVKHLQATVSEARALIAQTKALDVTSVDAFSSGYGAVLARLESISEAAQERARNDPALENASASFRPIVVYMTTDATSCAGSSEPRPGTSSLV